MPRVSVVILSNRPHLVGEAFASVVAQTYKDREIVVKFYDGDWWDEKINEGVRGTSGELVAVLCDDDKLAPTWLEKCVKALDTEHTDIAYTDNRVFGVMPLKLALPDFSLDTLNLHCVPHFTALTKRSLFERVGGYDGAQKHTDWDFWYRCAEAGATAAHVREYLFEYRVAGQNASTSIGSEGLAQLKAKHPGIAAAETRLVRVA